MTSFRKLFLKVIRKSKLFSKITALYGLQSKDSYLENLGWFQTFQATSSKNKAGDPIPWFSYPAIDFLDERISNDMVVFEFGSGNSTLWWSKKASRVVSIEHDLEWFESLQNNFPENVESYFSPFEENGEYSKWILKYENHFNVIVIDGRDRVNCALNSLQALKSNGIIIWDNSERARYQKGKDYLKENGFRELRFVGMSPITIINSSTSIFYREDNCLNL